MTSRLLRATVGTVLASADVLTFVANHALRAAPFSWEEVAIHVALLVASLLLIDPAIGKEVLDKLTERWNK